MIPESPRIVLDRNYILAAAGLLSTRDPDLALRFVLKEFARESVLG
jgi:MutL protein